MKNLLLIGNIDGHSKPLLKYASRMCKDLGLRLHILQIEPLSNPLILSSPYYFNKFGLMFNQTTSNKKKELESFVKDSTNEILDSEWISFNIMEGDVAHCIDKFINDKKIDLMVISQLVLSNIKIEQNQIFSKIFTNISELPMLVIPENEIYKGLEHLAFLTTFTQDNFNNIEWMTKNFKSIKIELIHSSQEKNSLHNKKWLAYLKSEILNSQITYKHIEDSIESFIDRKINNLASPYNAIALTTHKRNFWKRITDPSTTLNIVSKVEIPIFIFKIEQ
jgi:nucleotide-binding universal stress UspA family protein